jgi:hypothetical protein
MSDFNEFAKAHGARREVFDEDLKFRYQKKSLSVYTASIYGLPFVEFPVAAFTSEAAYLQWCIQVANMMPLERGSKAHKQFIRDRLAEAEEVEIPPNMEEGVEAGRVVLHILKNSVRNCRDFDYKNPDPEVYMDPELNVEEWVFLETVNGVKEVFIKFEGLMARILDAIAIGSTETKITRKDLGAWLKANGRHYNKYASPNRHRCAYVLPLELVEKYEKFRLRESTLKIE